MRQENIYTAGGSEACNDAAPASAPAARATRARGVTVEIILSG